MRTWLPEREAASARAGKEGACEVHLSGGWNVLLRGGGCRARRGGMDPVPLWAVGGHEEDSVPGGRHVRAVREDGCARRARVGSRMAAAPLPRSQHLAGLPQAT